MGELSSYLRFGLDVLALWDMSIGRLLIEPSTTMRARDKRGVGRRRHGWWQRCTGFQRFGDVARGLHCLAEHLTLLLPF